MRYGGSLLVPLARHLGGPGLERHAHLRIEGAPRLEGGGVLDTLGLVELGLLALLLCRAGRLAKPAPPLLALVLALAREPIVLQPPRPLFLRPLALVPVASRPHFVEMLPQEIGVLLVAGVLRVGVESSVLLRLLVDLEPVVLEHRTEPVIG